MNELKIDDLRGGQHTWIISAHKNKRLCAIAYYYPSGLEILFKISVSGLDITNTTNLTDAIDLYNRI